MEGASFGAGRAGAALDPVSFARRPQTLLRVASWVFSIAVFGPIINEGYVNADSGPELRCVFNGNAGACRFGVALGLGAFLACAAFLLLDVRFQQISSVRTRTPLTEGGDLGYCSPSHVPTLPPFPLAGS
uniref:Synaptogyrin 3 n=1 Tax=Microcebus murinus TaxID=30608 RepID=A0A8C5V0B5_MICMU